MKLFSAFCMIMSRHVSDQSISQIKVRRIQSVLDNLYPSPVPIPLNSIDDFTFLCAVILSAQTTDGKVNEVTKELFSVAGTPETLANSDVSKIQSIIQPVGLAPQKASNLVKMANRLVTSYESKVPNTYEDLESLAGVGHKTASVVMSQCFGEPAIAVDTHVHRLALRWGLSKEEKNVGKVQNDLCSVFPIEDWNKVSLQMIYFGREYCTAKDHTNSLCPICSWVHDNAMIPLTDLSSFIPHKKTKGIVYYTDRKQELSTSPELSSFSTKKAPNLLSKTITLMTESEPNSSNANVRLNIDDDSHLRMAKRKRTIETTPNKRQSSK